MPQSPVAAIETTVNKTHLWLRELEEIGSFQDESQAYSALRAVLHSLRDRLTVDEAAHFGAQCPMLVRGIYYEGWKPARMPLKGRSKGALVESVRDQLRGNVRIDPEQAVRAVFKLLDQKITEGEMTDVKEMMPEEARALWA